MLLAEQNNGVILTIILLFRLEDIMIYIKQAVYLICFICLFFGQSAEVCANSTDNIEMLGDYLQVIVPSIALGLAMNEDDYEGIKQLGYSFVSAQITVYGLKNVVEEKRPQGNGDGSFPSGHTTGAFSGAAFIHKRYGFKKAIIPYTLSAFVGYSRIQAKKHWTHDVICGALISYLYAYLFVDNITNNKLNIQADTKSMKVSYQFDL
jgi:membrane-associated phospholipid phosphatase